MTLADLRASPRSELLSGAGSYPQAINAARPGRLEAGEGAGSRPVFSTFFWALIAARNLEHWSKFNAFRATTSVQQLSSVYLNPSELSLIFCHLVHWTQAIRTSFVFLLKQSRRLRIPSPPLQQDCVPRTSRTPWGAWGSPAMHQPARTARAS